VKFRKQVTTMKKSSKGSKMKVPKSRKCNNKESKLREQVTIKMQNSGTIRK
jgi:hypothetical protein